MASLVCFAGLQAGAPFGYLDWLGMRWLAVIGNIVGGLGLVTLLPLLRVPHEVIEERAAPATGTGEVGATAASRLGDAERARLRDVKRGRVVDQRGAPLLGDLHRSRAATQ